MLLTLLRHGEVEGRANVFRGCSDPALSLRGEAQLREAVKHWSTPPVDVVLSSPAKRCVSFAKDYAHASNVPLVVLQELCEIDFGAWEELTPDEARVRNAQCFAAFEADTENWCPPQGESYVAFRTRIREAVDKIAQLQQQHQHIGVITHGGVIRAMLAEYLQLTSVSAARIAVPTAASCQLWLDTQRGAQLLWLLPLSHSHHQSPLP